MAGSASTDWLKSWPNLRTDRTLASGERERGRRKGEGERGRKMKRGGRKGGWREAGR